MAERLKKHLKQGIRACFRLTGPLMPSARRPTSRILTYHSIGYRRYAMNVTPGEFADQMAWLAEQQSVIPLADAARGVPGVAITFDDGYADNLEHAVPVLQRLKLPATIFIVTGHIGGTLPGERVPESGRLLSESALRDVRAAGVELGAHTVNHPRLSTLTPDAQEAEIRGAKQTLEGVLGQPVSAFAYPYGSILDYTPETEAIVARAGYAYACSNRYGHNTPVKNRWALRRIWVDQSDTARSFRDKVTGALDAMAVQDSTAGMFFRRSLNRVLRAD